MITRNVETPVQLGVASTGGSARRREAFDAPKIRSHLHHEHNIAIKDPISWGSRTVPVGDQE